MGYFKNIRFNNYRNFANVFLEFDSGLNIILGKNGSGKTNILEGLSLFEKGRGFRKERIDNLINFQSIKKGFEINSIFQNKNLNFNVSVFNSDKNLKKLSVNNNLEVESVKHFESLFSIIYFLPEMERLFVAPPSMRRNFLDRLIFTFNKDYNLIINNYKKSIIERQILLKNQNYDENWIKKIEQNIVKFGTIIYQKRIMHIDIINNILNEIHALKHFSNEFILKLNDDFLIQNSKIFEDKEIYLSKIASNRKLDFFSGGCSIGPHRSDVQGFNIKNNFKLSQLSTGQQKMIVLLIIIAQSKYLINILNLKPIVLLDEICSHLDDVNRELLLYLINELKLQVFMTGTEENFFSFLSTTAKYCNITK